MLNLWQEIPDLDPRRRVKTVRRDHCKNLEPYVGVLERTHTGEWP